MIDYLQCRPHLRTQYWDDRLTKSAVTDGIQTHNSLIIRPVLYPCAKADAVPVLIGENCLTFCVGEWIGQWVGMTQSWAFLQHQKRITCMVCSEQPSVLRAIKLLKVNVQSIYHVFVLAVKGKLIGPYHHFCHCQKPKLVKDKTLSSPLHTLRHLKTLWDIHFDWSLTHWTKLL